MCFEATEYSSQCSTPELVSLTFSKVLASPLNLNLFEQKLCLNFQLKVTKTAAKTVGSKSYTVNSLVSRHPRELKNMSVSRAVRLGELLP